MSVSNNQVQTDRWIDTLYRVAHKKRPQLCNDVVWLNSTIQTKRNERLKEQSQLNSMRNYDFIRFCFNSEIYAKEYWVYEMYKIANKFNKSCTCLQENQQSKHMIVVIYLECRPVIYNFVYIPWYLDITVVRQMCGKKLFVFTCVSYAEARNRLDVRPSVSHTLAPYQNG